MNNKIVKITGLDCANCAKALENQINKIDGVENARIDFIKSSLYFESENTAKSLKDIKTLTKKLEPDARIIEEKEDNTKSKKKFFFDLGILLAGIIVGLCVILLEEKLPVWAFWTMFVLSALLLGYKTYYKAVRLLLKGVINENFLITISVIGGCLISEYMEALMVIGLYTIGKILEGLAVNKSRKSIEKLTNIQPEYAVLVEGDKEIKINPNDVKVGSIIIVRPGEKVPIDGEVIEGSASIDMKSLTGENIPVHIEKGNEILSGSIVMDGILRIKTTNEYSNSTVSKILSLIDNASEKKSKTETLISKFTRWYTVGVVALALLVLAIVWAVTKDFNSALYRGLVFLVISCPCAFAISVPLAYFSGIGNASKRGILIKGSNYLDACAKLNVIAFDKTGTLTNGEFEAYNVISLDKTKSEEDILFLSALGEQASIHPLAKAIVKANQRPLEKVSDVKEVAGEGIYFKYKRKKYFVGRLDKAAKSTMVELYENDKKVGEIYLSDGLKETSKKACDDLTKLGIKTMLLSGDNEACVKRVAKTVGVTDCKYQLLPQEKYAWVEKEKKNKDSFVGFVGDGINDAPALMLADVGISMGITGTDASIEASDIVLVNDDPAKVATAIRLSKYTRKIVLENIIFSAGIKVVILILGGLGITGMLLAVFADVGVTLLAVLNSIRSLKHNPERDRPKTFKRRHDKTNPSNR